MRSNQRGPGAITSHIGGIFTIVTAVSIAGGRQAISNICGPTAISGAGRTAVRQTRPQTANLATLEILVLHAKQTNARRVLGGRISGT